MVDVSRETGDADWRAGWLTGRRWSLSHLHNGVEESRLARFQSSVCSAVNQIHILKQNKNEPQTTPANRLRSHPTVCFLSLWYQMVAQTLSAFSVINLPKYSINHFEFVNGASFHSAQKSPPDVSTVALKASVVLISDIACFHLIDLGVHSRHISGLSLWSLLPGEMFSPSGVFFCIQ